MRRLSHITHVGRTIDLRRPSNVFAMLAPIGAALVVYGLDTNDVRRAVSTGLATFAAWAIARELDPDRPPSAVLAAIAAPVAALVVGPPAPAPLFVVMVTLRILVRSTGLPPKTTDLAVLVLAAVAVGDTPWGWAAAILLAFAMVRDAALPGDPPPNVGLWGAALAVGVTARVALSDSLGAWEVPETAGLVVLAVGLAGAMVVVRPIPVLALADWTKTSLEPSRLREAALFGILAGALSAVAAGGPGIVAIAPLLLTYAAVAVVRSADGVGA
ncbi:MAG TPA: hypothetical protein VMS74_06860 [Acidimicrobiia bacterium]|nr:hypothetical protein [Acidimicrobiia bacterium]